MNGHRPLFRCIATVFVATASVVGPLLLGSTGPWPRFALEVAMGIACLLWAVGGAERPWTMLLPLAAIGLGACQTVPLPDAILVALAPISAGAWKVARAGVPDAWGYVSIDPATTLTSARRLFLGCAVVVAVTEIARSARERGILVLGLAASGVLIVTLGLLFPSKTGETRILGFVDLAGPIQFYKTPIVHPVQTGGFSAPDWVVVGDQRYISDGWVIGDRVGSYIISNHFAAGVYLTLPVLLGCVLALPRTRALGIAAIILASAIAGIGFYTVASVARSRAGSVAMLVALTTFAALAVPVRSLRIACGAVAAVAGLVVVSAAFALYGPFTELDRFAPERSRDAVNALLQDGRVQASRFAGRMLKASPLLGTGLGSFDELGSRMIGEGRPWFYAHNDYAQWLAETGCFGGCGLALVLVWLVRGGMRFSRRPWCAADLPVGGAWAAIAGIAAHSFFDWNLHVPANAFLTAVVAGVAMSVVSGQSVASTAWWARRGVRLTVTLLLSTALMASLGLLGRDAWASSVERRLRTALVSARMAARDPERPSPEPVLVEALAAGQRAVRWDPGNASIWLLLGQLHLHLAVARPDDATRLQGQATNCFEHAQQRSAVLRGLPEPLPQPARKRP